MCEVSQRLPRRWRYAGSGNVLVGEDFDTPTFRSGAFTFAMEPHRGAIACLVHGTRLRLSRVTLDQREQWGIGKGEEVVATFVSPLPGKQGEEYLVLVNGFRIYLVPSVGQTVQFSALGATVISVPIVSVLTDEVSASDLEAELVGNA